MFLELDKLQFWRITDLISQVSEECQFVFPVLKSSKARVFVDDHDHPKTSLICDIYGKYLLIGREDKSEFNAGLFEFLTGKSNHDQYYDLYISEDLWADILDKELRGRIVRLKHTVYCHKRTWDDPEDANVQLEEKLTINKIDEVLFNKIVSAGYKSLGKHWLTAENFCEKSFGFCITEDEKIACVVNACYVGNGYAEIDIFTHPDYRRKGCAYKACIEFMRYCYKNQLKPLWVCDYGNEASNGLAEKLGFTKIKDFDLFWWHENDAFIEEYLKNFKYQ